VTSHRTFANWRLLLPGAESQLPYLAGLIYALTVSAVGIELQPIPPRFMDLYLIGMMLIALRWSWKPAEVVYVVSLVAAVLFIQPVSSAAVSGGANRYRMFSYTATSVVATQVIERAKRRWKN